MTRDSDRIEQALTEQHPPHSMVVRADARAMGAVTAHTTRASRDSWQTSGRVRGYAGNAEGIASTEPDTVLVTYADGTQEIRKVSSFRKRASEGRRRAKETARKVTEVERMGLVNNIGQDYS